MAKIRKADGVQILMAFADGTGAVFGLGNDQKIYNWHHSLEHRGYWVLHVNEPAGTTKEIED